MKTQKNNKAFTLIELLMVITIIAILMSVAIPGGNAVLEMAKINSDSQNVKQIITACHAFAADNEGSFPAWDPDAESSGGSAEEGQFSTSTEAFNVLLRGGYVDGTEKIFWYKTKNPAKARQPKENGELMQEEVTYTYVSGQSNSGFSSSPLIADEQEGPGTYGEYHPWLGSRKAVVGYCGNSVVVERLDTKEPGAVVQTRDKVEIFKERTSEEGESGGMLRVGQDQILNP